MSWEELVLFVANDYYIEVYIRFCVGNPLKIEINERIVCQTLHTYMETVL